ncbi:hypothetical protein WN55_01333 [Dufourea novaeangliae]|uniref:Uncharacterized protein n=1 Tax=Dufourea novaeangliae TaxID=178035 RepID=A0A154PEG5_DUFNO|nr:hypothetical protein WN55_01333 [Dufourea novaeangliae]
MRHFATTCWHRPFREAFESCGLPTARERVLSNFHRCDRKTRGMSALEIVERKLSVKPFGGWSWVGEGWAIVV